MKETGNGQKGDLAEHNGFLFHNVAYSSSIAG